MEMVHISCVAATHTLCLPILSTNEEHHQGYINNYILLIQAQEELLNWPFLGSRQSPLSSLLEVLKMCSCHATKFCQPSPNPYFQPHFLEEAVAKTQLLQTFCCCPGVHHKCPEVCVFLMLFSLLRLFSYVGKVLLILFFFFFWLFLMSLH